MPLKQKDVDELKRIYSEEFGKSISNQEAWDMAIRLVSLFTALTRRGLSSKVESLKNLTDDNPKS